MSKQKRTTPQDRADLTGEQGLGGPDLDGLELGNQAAWAELSGGAGPGRAPLDVVRDAAHPLVERAILALQLEPRTDREVARYVEIVERSKLPPDQRAVLVDHLQTD